MARSMKRSSGRGADRNPKGQRGITRLIKKDMKRRNATDDWSGKGKNPGDSF